MSEEFVPLSKAALELGIPPDVLEQVIARRELAAFPAGGVLRVRRSDLDRYKVGRAQEAVVFPHEEDADVSEGQEAAGALFHQGPATGAAEAPASGPPVTADVGTASASATPARQPPSPSASLNVFRVAMAGLLALAVLGAAASWGWRRLHPAPKAGPPPAARVVAAATVPDAIPQPGPPAPERPAATDWATAGYCPADSVAFLGVRDLPGLLRLTRDSAPCKALLEDLGRREPWLAALARLPGLAARSAGETALALTEIERSAHYDPLPHLLLLARPAEPSPGALDALAERLFAEIAKDAPGLQRREAAYAGIPIQFLGDGDVTFARAIHRDTLLIASDEATLHRALDLGNGKGASLGRLEAFSELCAETGGTPCFAFVGAPHLLQRLPMLSAGAAGLPDIDAFALALEASPPVFVERLVLHTRGPRRGLLAWMDPPPLARPLDVVVPDRLLSLCQARVAPGKTWDGALQALKQVQGPTDHASLLASLEGIRRRCGFDLREELLQSLGDTVTTTLAEGKDPATPDLVCAWTLAHPEGCLSCVERTLATLDLHGEAPPFRRRWVEGTEVFVVDPKGWNEVMTMPYPAGTPPFAFGVVRGSLVVANRPELVARHGRGKRLPPAMTDALATLPEGAWAVSCTDSRAALNRLADDLQVRKIPFPPALAGLLASDAPLAPAITTLTSTARCVILESRAPLPIVTAALAGLALGAPLPYLQPRDAPPGE